MLGNLTPLPGHAPVGVMVVVAIPVAVMAALLSPVVVTAIVVIETSALVVGWTLGLIAARVVA